MIKCPFRFMKSGPENQFCTGEGPPVPSPASSLRGDEGGEDEEMEGEEELPLTAAPLPGGAVGAAALPGGRAWRELGWPPWPLPRAYWKFM